MIKPTKKQIVTVVGLICIGYVIYKVGYKNGTVNAYGDICSVVSKEKISKFIFKNSKNSITILMQEVV